MQIIFKVSLIPRNICSGILRRVVPSSPDYEPGTSNTSNAGDKNVNEYVPYK